MMMWLVNFVCSCNLDATTSGGSRISRWGGADPLGGRQPLTHVHFSVNMYVKTKEMDPVGGRRAPPAPPPPGSANDYTSPWLKRCNIIGWVRLTGPVIKTDLPQVTYSVNRDSIAKFIVRANQFKLINMFFWMTWIYRKKLIYCSYHPGCFPN